jgi:hypothetical protein
VPSSSSYPPPPTSQTHVYQPTSTPSETSEKTAPTTTPSLSSNSSRQSAATEQSAHHLPTSRSTGRQAEPAMQSPTISALLSRTAKDKQSRVVALSPCSRPPYPGPWMHSNMNLRCAVCWIGLGEAGSVKGWTVGWLSWRRAMYLRRTWDG